MYCTFEYLCIQTVWCVFRMRVWQYFSIFKCRQCLSSYQNAIFNVSFKSILKGLQLKRIFLQFTPFFRIKSIADIILQGRLLLWNSAKLQIKQYHTAINNSLCILFCCPHCLCIMYHFFYLLDICAIMSYLWGVAYVLKFIEFQIVWNIIEHMATVRY